MSPEDRHARLNHRASHLLAAARARLALFLSLQQNPDVMRFVAHERSEADIREAFVSRLLPWAPGSSHWLCLVVRETASQTPLGVTGYVHREADCAEVGFLFAPSAQGKGYGFESLRAVCDFALTRGNIRRLTATVTAGNIASRRLLEKQVFSWKVSCARVISFQGNGITTGYSVY